MTDYEPADNIHTFFRWWSSLKAWGEQVPLLERFEPALSPGLDDNIFLFERIPDGSYAVRYWGSELARVTVGSLNQQDVLDRYSDKDAEINGQHFAFVTGRPCGGMMRREVLLKDGRMVMTDHLSLPIKSEDGLIRHVAGCAAILAISEAGRRRAVASQTIKSSYYVDLGHGIPAGEEAYRFGDVTDKEGTTA